MTADDPCVPSLDTFEQRDQAERKEDLMDAKETRKMDATRRHELLSELMKEYEDDAASVKTILANWDDESFDEGDYEELVGILELF